MRRKLPFVLAILLVPASVYADPIDIGSLPPHPTVLCSLLAEVLVVAALVSRFRLKMLLFLPIWYAVNLFSFFLLLNGFFYLAGLFSPPQGLGAVIIISAEGSVIIAEAAALYGLSRLPLLQKSDSKKISFGWAVTVSLIGNIVSIVTFPLWALIPWRKI
jgi:hypothetical protein